MTNTFQTYGDARTAAVIVAHHMNDTMYLFERNGQFIVTGWGDDVEDRREAQFLGRVLPDGTWSPRQGKDEEARPPQAGSREDTMDESPLAGIEITRKTADLLNADADWRKLSREAYRAMVLFLAYADKDLLGRADHLVRQLGITSVKDMAERGW